MITVERTETAVPLTLSVTRGNSGVSGLTVNVEIRNGATNNSYLDFSDGVFKTIGWVQKQLAMVDLGGGFYSQQFDLSTTVSPPNHLIAEYDSGRGVTTDCILVKRTVYDELGESVDGTITARDALANANAMARGKIIRSGNDFAHRNNADDATLFTNQKSDTERTPI
jgi:hypothetical protein